MKKILLSLLMMAIAVTATAQTIGEAFYIYRNDGGFNAFFREEVDSMVYSNYDNDSIHYDDVVTQVVYTPDSVYRIPLAAIDSVGFVTPKNVTKEGVLDLSGSLFDFLVKYEGACLYFLESTPSSLLPSKGDKLVTTDMTEMFPCGFAGEVISIEKRDGYFVVECSGLELEDVFDSYSYAIDLAGNDDSSSAMRVSPNVDRTFDVPTMSHSWGLGVGTPIFDVNGSVTASLTPKFHVKGNDLVDPVRGRMTNIRVTCNYDTSLSYEFGVEKSETFDFPFPGGRGERPICPLLSFFWDFGMFVGVSGGVTYSQTFTQSHVSYLDYIRVGNKIPNISFNKPIQKGGNKEVGRLALNGTLRGGWYGELGVKPWLLDKNSNFGGKVSGRLEVGLEAVIERGIDLTGLREADRSTALYDFVDNAGDLTLPSLTVSPYASVDITVKVGPWDTHWAPWKGKFGSPIYEGGYFPHFSNVKYERTNNTGMVKFTSDLSRTCPFLYKIGFSALDESGNIVKTEYAAGSYSNPYTMPSYEVAISGLDKDKKYKVHPTINVFNYPVLASPYVTVMPCPVKITDFHQTGSQYKKDGFAHDGVTYDYRFDVSVTVTLEDDKNVHDWGYVYRDPNGRETEISLSRFGKSYTDTRYAYFRNQASSTVCLFGYVKYVDSDETVYGEPKDYDVSHSLTYCPDGNHPHMIDLGLPSGTKWACCNVGATTPEGYGGYYAWGETEEKDYYTWGTYIHCNGSYDTCHDLGSDIAGTGYDVAHVRWGGSWVMPSLDQIKELLNKCSTQWTTKNGVNGRTFTGPSGGTIFLPAAGYRWDDYLSSAGSGGLYWSSTQNPSYSSRAYYLSFNSGGAHWYDYSRDGGHTVRPVSR